MANRDRRGVGGVPGTSNVNTVAGRTGTPRLDGRVRRVDTRVTTSGQAAAARALGDIKLGMAAEFARGLDRIGAKLGQAADRAALAEGKKSGALAGREDGFQPTGDQTIFGAAFDASGIETFKNKMVVAVATQVDELATQHAGDPVGLAKSLDGAAAGWLEKLGADENLAAAVLPQFEAVFNRQRLSAMHGATREAMRRQKAEAVGALDAAITSRTTALAKNAYRLATTPEASAALAGETADLTEALAAAGPDGAPLLSPARQAEILNATARKVVEARIAGVYDHLDTPAAKLDFLDGVANSDMLGDFPKADQADIVDGFRARYADEVFAGVFDNLALATEEDFHGRLDLAFPEDSAMQAFLGPVYRRLDAEVGRLRRQRLEDPAASVADLPAAKEAKAARVPGDPQSEQNYVTTMMGLQADAGVISPETLPRAEARAMLRGVQPDANGNISAGIRSLAGFVEATYGPLADQVFSDIMIGAGRETIAGNDFSVPVLAALRRGDRPGNRELEALARRGDIADATLVSDDGLFIDGGPSGESFTPFAAPVPGERPFSKRTPTFAAIQHLIADPDAAGDFDQEFGPGSARAILADPRDPFAAMTPADAELGGFQVEPPAPAATEAGPSPARNELDRLSGGLPSTRQETAPAGDFVDTFGKRRVRGTTARRRQSAPAGVVNRFGRVIGKARSGNGG